MSKITISLVCGLIRLLLVFLGKGVRLVYTIMDLVDDGIINQSAEKPHWYEVLASSIVSIEEVMAHFTAIDDELTIGKSE